LANHSAGLPAVPWPTWKQSAIAALVAWLIGRLLPRFGSKALAPLIPAAFEFALVSGLYSIWRIARTLPFVRDEGAIERARDIVRFESWLHLPSELSLQELVLRSDIAARMTNWYYAVLHVPALVAFLIWLFARHRDVYPRWRNGLAMLTGCCLVIRFVRVAPPRFLPDLGYIDLSTRYGLSVYGPVGTGVSDQFAAMPSIHVGWAAVVSLGIISASASRWRWLFGLHLVVTLLVVSATGHHWWLDGIVAIALLLAGLRVDDFIRKRRAITPSVLV
jgi:hypothetical protein